MWIPGPMRTSGREKIKKQGLDVRGHWAGMMNKEDRVAGIETIGRDGRRRSPRD